MRWVRIIVGVCLAAIAPAVAQNPAAQAMEAGVEALTRGEYAAAQEAFIRAVEANPESGRAWLGLADASRRVGAITDAEDALEKAIEKAASDPGMHRGLAVYYSEADDPERAAAHLGQHIRLVGPEAAPGLFAEVSRLYLEAGMAESAEQFARSGLERGAEAKNLTALGAAQARLGQPDAAAATLAAAIQKDPYEEERHWLLARLFLELGRYGEAANVIETGLGYFDKSPLLHFGLGLARLGEGSTEAALEAFLQAARYAPAAAWAHEPLSELRPSSGQRARIEQQLRTHHERVGGAESAVLLARVLSDDAEAMELLEETFARHPGNWRVALELGGRLETEGDHARSLAAYEQAVRAEPRRPAPHYRLGRLAAQMGRDDLAQRELDLHARLAAQQPAAGRIERLLETAPGLRLSPQAR